MRAVESAMFVFLMILLPVTILVLDALGSARQFERSERALPLRRSL
jgi:hypothetical protein